MITPAVAVTALDALGNVATQFTGNVTVAIGTNPGGGTLSGTTVRTAVAGVATFNDLSINRAALGYRLSASAAGLTSGTSIAFNIIVGAAAQLVFAVQPTNQLANVNISPTVRVNVVDAEGNTVFSHVGTITLTLIAPNGATLTGGGPIVVSDGHALFPNLRVDLPGNYTLQAASSGLAGTVSSSFAITSLAGLGQD